MNHNMFHNPIVQDNMDKLIRFDYEIIPPDSGMLANGDSGDGRMPDEKVLLQYILKEIACKKRFSRKKDSCYSRRHQRIHRSCALHN